LHRPEQPNFRRSTAELERAPRAPVRLNVRRGREIVFCRKKPYTTPGRAPNKGYGRLLLQRNSLDPHNGTTSQRNSGDSKHPQTGGKEMSNVTFPNEQLMEEVREVNLGYLVLSQHMIRADKAQAMYRLGISEEVAGIIDQLSPSQLMKIAGANQLICRFRFDDDMVWNLLTNHSKARASGTGAVAWLHANIVMAGQIANVGS